jgi:hypothetical protein
MIKVKTFASPLKVFHVKEQLENLDTMINQFIAPQTIPVPALESFGLFLMKNRTGCTLSADGSCFLKTMSEVN